MGSRHGCSREQQDRCRKYQGNNEKSDILHAIFSAYCKPAAFRTPLMQACAQTPANRPGLARPPRGCPAKPSPPLTAGPGLLAAPQGPAGGSPRARVTTRRSRGRTDAQPPQPHAGPGAALAPDRLRAQPDKPTGRGLSPPSAARPPAKAGKGPVPPPPQQARGLPAPGRSPQPGRPTPPRPQASRSAPFPPGLRLPAPPPPRGLLRRAGLHRSPGAGGSAGPSPPPACPGPAAASATAAAAAPTGNPRAQPITARRDVNAPRSHPEPSPR